MLFSLTKLNVILRSYGKITFSFAKLNVILFDQTKCYFATAQIVSSATY